MVMGIGVHGGITIISKPLTSQVVVLPPLYFPKIHTPPILNHKTRRRQIRSNSSFNSSSSNSRPSPSSDKECPVPFDQQPINEYQSLSNSFPFSWATADLVEFYSKIFATGACFALFLGLPISWVGSSKPHVDLIRVALGSASTGLLMAILGVIRMYLGWAYVGNRLLSATVEYEETGWYDGQIWVKSAEVLARDRLLGSFSVKPVLSRLKNTLLVLGTSLFISVALFVNLEDGSGRQNFDAYTVSSSGSSGAPRVYNDESARSFEPDAFCGGSSVQ